MPITAVVIPLAVGLNAGLLLLLPDLSRPGIFFSVCVPPSFRDEAPARRALWVYRLAVITASVGLLLVFPALRSDIGRVGALFGPGGAALLAWSWASHHLRPHAVAPERRRVASLRARDVRLPGGWPAVIVPFVMLAGAAWLLYVGTDRIPGQFPTRWAADGSPIRWTVKSVSSVYGPLLLGVGVVALMLGQATLVLRRSRQIAADGSAGAAEWQFKRRDVLYRVLSAQATAFLFSYFGTRKVMGAATLGPELWLFLAALAAGSAGMTGWMIRQGQGGTLAAHAEGGDFTADDAWWGGVLYVNRQDPVLFIERRRGIGWTLNFGNPWAWVLVASLGAAGLALLVMR